MTRIIKDFKFECEEEEYFANAKVIYHVESDYGSDADGNRGSHLLIVDDVIIYNVQDIKGQLLTKYNHKELWKLYKAATDQLSDFSWL